MRLGLHRRTKWLLVAGLGLAVLSGCNRGGPEQGSLNEGTSAPDDLPPAANEQVNLVSPPAPTNTAAAPDKIVEPNLSREEQVLDDAEASGMTARTHDGLATPPDAQPVETAGDSSGRRSDKSEAPADGAAQSGNAEQVSVQ